MLCNPFKKDRPWGRLTTAHVETVVPGVGLLVYVICGMSHRHAGDCVGCHGADLCVRVLPQEQMPHAKVWVINGQHIGS